MLLGSALVSCGTAEPPAGGELSTTAETIDGVVHVSNRGAPPPWSLSEAFTLGRAFAEARDAGPDEFGWIAGVVADSDGHVYVADALASEIRVFDADGSFLRRLGRRGSGPGEFQALTSIGWLGDYVASIDVGNGRFGIMSATGNWVDQRPFRGGDGVRLLPSDGDAVYVPLTRVTDGVFELAYVRQTISGPTDTLPGLTNPQGLEDASTYCTYGGGISGRREAAFAPKLLSVPAPGLRWAEVWSADYRLVFRDTTGDTVVVVERDVPRQAVNDAAWEREIEAFDAFLDENPDASCDPRRLPRPSAMSLIRSVFFDQAGGLWVERVAEHGSILDSFDAGGRLLGEVAIPPRLDRLAPYVFQDRVYLVATDVLDREFVQVFDIVGRERSVK